MRCSRGEGGKKGRHVPRQKVRRPPVGRKVDRREGRNTGGGAAGFLWAVRNDFRTDLATVHILQVYVFPEFRGLGLAKALFRFFHDMIGKMDIRRITIELMGESLHLNNSFRGEGFSPFSEVLELDLSFRGESGSD
jgi:GNAT superfamily N-acetyltransferase